MRTGIARALGCLVTVGCALLATAGPAGADPPDHRRHLVESGPEVSAFWSWSAPGTNLMASVDASDRFLYASLVATRYDRNLNVIGETHTTVSATEGFVLKLDRPLDGATVTASSIPATICDYDAELNLIGCRDTTTSVAVSVTGYGDIQNDPAIVVNTHQAGFHLHASGTRKWRSATATGSIADVALPVGEAWLSAETDVLVLKLG